MLNLCNYGHFFYSSVGGTKSDKTVNCFPPQKGQHYYFFQASVVRKQVICHPFLFFFFTFYTGGLEFSSQIKSFPVRMV